MRTFATTLIVIIALTGCAIGPGRGKPADSPSHSTAPEDRTARLTSYMLIRKIESVRNRAVYLKHREEGKRLLEIMGETIQPET